MAGNAVPTGSADQQFWQIAFPPQPTKRRPAARLAAAAASYRPFSSFVCRTAALREAVDVVAAWRLGDGMLEELLIMVELALRGHIDSFTDLAIAMGPAARLDAYRTPAEAYRRFLDPAWFARFSSIAPQLGGRLERSDWTAYARRFPGLWQAVKGFVRHPGSGISLPANWAEDRIRNAVGDALFSIMAGKVLAAAPSEPGLRALTQQLARHTGHSTLAIERLEADIRDYWAIMTAPTLTDAGAASSGVARRD